jgi:arginine/lysine/ornithine decarboxylase
MDTPICDFVREYVRRDTARLHMPGHKGRPFLGCEALDITEISGADNLFEAGGIIMQSEKNAARLFGTKQTFYSAGGSSACVKAMLYLALQNAAERPGRPFVLAARNVHRSFLHACALLDLDVEWLQPGPDAGSVCSCPVTPAALAGRLEKPALKPIAVFVTSPDYLGIKLDVGALAAVCKERGIPLLADNAHGAYLKFLPESVHPMDLGADLCCDSAHKTLPVLTGGAYLHVAHDAPDSYAEEARRALSLFGSSSPSYLILQSLDLCNRTLAEGYPEKLARCAARVESLKAALRELGYLPCGDEPLKLTLDAAALGRDGRRIAARLRERGVECEYADARYTVLMFSPENREEDYLRAEEALREPLPPVAPPTFPGWPMAAEQAMSVREALLAAHETLPASLAEGRVCGAPALAYPPAVPLCVGGERIPPGTAALLRYYGVEEVEGVRKK